MSELEKRVCKGCCLGLSGLKAASLYSLKPEIGNVENTITELNSKLAKTGSKVKILHKNSKRTLIFAYNSERLEEHLKDEKNREFLERYGYGHNDNADSCLSTLSFKMESGIQEFPHEIGVFLGYPIEDVEGFINNRDNCMAMGLWKVYRDVDKKKEMFEKFDEYTKDFSKKIEETDRIEELFKEN